MGDKLLMRWHLGMKGKFAELGSKSHPNNHEALLKQPGMLPQWAALGVAAEVRARYRTAEAYRTAKEPRTVMHQS